MDEKKQADSDLERLLNFYPAPKFKVAVHRTEPLDYAGYLDTIDVFDYEDISLNMLIESYGGGKYSLRIMNGQGRYLTHRSIQIAGPPMQRGKQGRRTRVVQNETDDLKKEIDKLKAEQSRIKQTVKDLVARLDGRSAANIFK